MQLDMHYYGTYAMARAAGLKKESCEIIATAAQFVDDNAEKESVEFRDGARLDVEATAHHAINIKNIDRAEDRKERIAVAAYYKAEKRGFKNGDETQDWLEAEATVDRLHNMTNK